MKKIAIVMLLCALSLGAQKPSKGRRAKAKAAETEEVQPEVAAPSAGIADTEMAAIRAVQVRNRATYADACRLVLLQRGEFLKYQTDEDRCRAVSALGFVKTEGLDIYKTPISLGAAAKLAIYAHDLEKSMMLKITGWSWYAISNAESLGLIPEGMNAGDRISGAELVQLMDEALAQSEARTTWNHPENPYKEFGYETYEQMYHNPSGPATISPAKTK